MVRGGRACLIGRRRLFVLRRHLLVRPPSVIGMIDVVLHAANLSRPAIKRPENDERNKATSPRERKHEEGEAGLTRDVPRSTSKVTCKKEETQTRKG